MSMPRGKLAPHLWWAANTTERDAISLAEGAEVGDFCLVLADGTAFSAATVGAASSTWTGLEATPTAHASTHNATGSDELAIDAVAGTGSLRTLGTAATAACAGNDSRLSDARTPTAHKGTHISGGGDAFATTDLLEAVVKRIQTTTGPTTMLVGAVADGEYLKRVGSTIVSGAPAGGGPGSDTTAIHDDTAAEISAITEKTALVSADLILIEDSAASNAKKRVKISNVPGRVWMYFKPTQAEFPNTGFATLDERNNHPVLDFDPDSDEECFFTGIMHPDYITGYQINYTLIWSATTATGGNVRWNLDLERIADSGQDIDSDGWSGNGPLATDAADATCGKATYTTGYFDGSALDGLQASELFRLRVVRDADNVADTMTGDAELLGVLLEMGTTA